MSDFFDMAASTRSQDDLARVHARGANDEIEAAPVFAVVCVGLGIFLLWLVLG